MPLNFISIKVSVGAPVNRWLMLAVFSSSKKSLKKFHGIFGKMDGRRNFDQSTTIYGMHGCPAMMYSQK